MNKARRVAVEALLAKAEDLQSQFATLKDEAESLHDEEEEYMNNIPENMQGSERYSQSESVVEALSTAKDTDDIEEFVSQLEQARDA